MDFVDAEHLGNWVAQGKATITGVALSVQFHDYLLSLPWLPTRLDWSAISHEEIDCGPVGDEYAVEIGRSLPIGRHSHVLVMYAPDQPGLACDFETAMANLDYLYWKAPGNRYICGASESNDGYDIYPSDFAETDGVHVRFKR